jgi:hypothetical protein
MRALYNDVRVVYRKEEAVAMVASKDSQLEVAATANTALQQQLLNMSQE